MKEKNFKYLGEKVNLHYETTQKGRTYNYEHGQTLNPSLPQIIVKAVLYYMYMIYKLP